MTLEYQPNRIKLEIRISNSNSTSAKYVAKNDKSTRWRALKRAKARVGWCVYRCARFFRRGSLLVLELRKLLRGGDTSPVLNLKDDALTGE